MYRVVVLNNYPFEEVWGEVERREKPDHHLYGINYFYHRGYEVEIVPYKNSPFLQSINQLLSKGKFPVPLGDLDQQWSTLRFLNNADLIYAPCQTQTYLLSYLRALGLIKIPIVSLAHHPLARGRLSWLRSPFTKLWVRGNDAFPSLSQAVADEINLILPLRSSATNWGPDANFYPYLDNLGKGVVAAGRTGRDFITFGLAASQTNTPTHIICLENSVSSAFKTFGNNVQITVQPDNNYMKYPELLEIYANARVLAIPMVSGFSLSGLTSLMDALGMGKPVIMTKNPFIDIDIEAEGIGKWVAPGDIEGWKNAIKFFEDNEEQALEMGKKARKLVDTRLCSKTFAHQIIDIFDKVIETK
jgi:glycosyltransferase involved in cell wall biosynthesis